ncbi:MAG: ABC transporter ATP-binding protein [Bifidobacterium sp.]|jgi:iron complex transport system ATP-binding protein|nr:ABC transporter ATP-binding protein [Bifidobacterium sp.]MCH4174229.1 ABC transporter ATP-binding protein [Bifidobacterium sp.]
MTLSIEHIAFSHSSTKILRDISFSVPNGSLLALLGPNGAGKSTLAKIIARIHKPSNGSIRLDDTDLLQIPRKQHARMVSYVPQSSAMPFELNVQESVMMGRTPYTGLRPRDEDYDIVDAAIQALHLEDLRKKNLSELSGGQAQRVLIARALAQEPEALILDEPTSALDLRYQVDTLELVRSVSVERHIASIIVIHDLNMASAYCDDVVLLDQGNVVQQGRPVEVLTPERLSNVYGVDVEVNTLGNYPEVRPCSLRSAKQRISLENPALGNSGNKRS